MAAPTVASEGFAAPFKRWLLKERIEQIEGPETRGTKERQQPWWKVVCLTGVDYYSTLGYIPSIAALAVGALSPVATLLIVALTLFAMVPMYRRVAEGSPHGQGSIAMLERLLSFWPGKLMVLALLGFLATDFLITITLSASDPAVHLAENPLVPTSFRDQELLITLLLVAVLGGVFLKGFKEAIILAVRHRRGLPDTQPDRRGRWPVRGGDEPREHRPLAERAVQQLRESLGDGGGGAPAFPEACPGRLRLRNGRQRDAAGAGRVGGRPRAPGWPHPQHQEALDYRRADYELLPHYHELHHGRARTF